ncbi:MAG: MFS transporter [Candidatus Thorarchaeota archaeon]|nr:MAG: MFS transporter [Candidatus Thorarchaeota archaeon]
MATMYHRVLGISDLNSDAREFISRATSLMILYVFSVMLTNTFLIIHALEFVTLTDLSLILAAQFAVQASTDYPSGAIGDWLGQRWVLFVAGLSYGVGFIVLSQAFDFVSVLSAFILVAFAQSQESGTFIAWFDNNYKLYSTEDRDRRTYSQFYGKFTMIGEILTAVSFLLGGAFLAIIDRQLLFLVQGFLLLFVSLILLSFIRDHESLKRDKLKFKSYLRYLRGGVTTATTNKTLRIMILGMVISGVGFAIWSGLILFPLYAAYAKTDAWTAILRAGVFVLGAICIGVAGMVSKRIYRLQRWLAVSVLLTDVLFFLGMYIMLQVNPVPSTFTLVSILFVMLSFAVAFSPRYLADVLKPRFYLDVIPDENRNAVYSLIPTLILIVSVFALPAAGVLIEIVGQETVILILAVNGLVGSSITAYAIYRHRIERKVGPEAVEPCCPVFPSKMVDTQTIIPLTLPCCWSFDPVTEYIWSQLREIALRDQAISEEEGSLIDRIVLDVRAYGEVLGKALEDGEIDEGEREELRKARNKVWIEANSLAGESGHLTSETQEILKRLTDLLKYLEEEHMFPV